MRNKFIIGNWKMNKDIAQVDEFMTKFSQLLDLNRDKIGSEYEFGIAAPVLHLVSMVNFEIEGLHIFSQNIHQNPNGAFTGEISADMVASTGAYGTLIGHSERRAYFNETDEQVNAKTILALSKGLVPVVCVGEVLAEFEKGITLDVIKRQIEQGLKNVDVEKVIIAYEPVWAIGTGKSATAQIAQDVCAYIRTLTSEKTLILYGGSVSPDNIASYMANKDVDGALVGGASLTPESFIKLLTLNKG